MANDRISQEPVEVVVLPTSGKGRVSQEPVEAVVSPTSGKGRISQEPVEALVLPTSQKGRTSQVVVEVLVQQGGPISVTVADSLSSISESPVGVLIFGRTASDSVSTLTESVSRTQNLTRTLSESVSTITEAASRVWSGARTVADSVSSITESVTALNVILRTVADSISTLTESISRVATNARAMADSLASLTESVSRVATYPRIVADSLTSITEAVTGAVVILRAAADSLNSITESVSRIKTLNRAVADSVSSISDAVTRVGATARQIVDVIAGIFEAVFSSGAPATPPSPPTPATFDLTVAGVSILYDPVMYEKAHFESQVNGVAGSCTFRVRDDDFSHSFTEGQEIVLTINNQTAWRGFITAIKRVYAFDAINVDQSGPTRFFDIEGADINTLLTKRIVFDQADGAHVEAPLLAPYTPDLTAIQELFADWLDLTGDGLDTTTLVQNVADTTWSQEGRAWEGSDTWAQAMQSIASLPAAIYYINPDKKFVYTDVDTANAPFKLSDQPDGVTSFGYSNMEILKDGTSLANDVMCWGIGYGSQTPVFERVEDATSQAAHGLWQLGQTTFGVYKQDTITRIADSIVYGSPQSKRGAKDDRISVQCVTYQNGLRVGEKVDFTSNVFGFNDVIPIRKMEIDFPTPDQPRYTLVLSHEIDTPFSFFDNYWFNFNFNLPKLCPPGYVMGPSGCVPVPIPIPGTATCPTTETFTRTVSPSWGISEIDALPWTTTFPTNFAIATPGQAVYNGPGFLGFASMNLPLQANYATVPVNTEPTETLLQITIPSTASNGLIVSQYLQGNGRTYVIDLYRNGSNLDIEGYGDHGSGFDFPGMVSNVLSSFLDAPFYVRTKITSTPVMWKVWKASDPEPSTWTTTANPATGFENTPGDGLNEVTLSYTGNGFGTAVNSFEFVTGYVGCGQWVGGTNTTKYYVQDKSKNHASDSDYFTIPTLREGQQSIPSDPTYSTVTDVAFQNQQASGSGVVTKAWLAFGGPSAVSVTVEFGPTGGYWDIVSSPDIPLDMAGDPMQVALFPFDGNVRMDTPPYAVVPSGTVIDVQGLPGVYIQPWMVTKSFPDSVPVTTNQGVWWTHYGGSATEPPAALASQTGGYEPFRITVVENSGGVWTSVPSGSTGTQMANSWVCEKFDGISPVLTLSRSFLLNSAQVWVDGLLQPQSTYIQDAATKTITLDLAPVSTATVCYWALI